MKYLSGVIARAVEAAGSLTGKRFGIFVASSVVATSAIVAAAMTNSHGSGPLADLLGRSLAADRTPAAVAPPAEAAETEPEPAAAESAQAASEAAAPEALPTVEPSPTPEASPAAEPEAPAQPAAPAAKAPEAGQVKHVFLISLDSPGYEAAFGTSPQMPYLATTLRPKGELLSGYSLLASAGAANAIATVSGQAPNSATKANCTTYSEFPPTTPISKQGTVSGSGCVYPVEVLTLADQLGSARFSWRAYVEGMVDTTGKAANCVHPESDGSDEPAAGAYAARANPFVYFHSLLDLGDCASNDVPFTELEKDLKKPAATPNFSYIAPSLCNAGVPGQCTAGAPEGAAAADAYLAQLVPRILASPAYKKDGLLIISFGEASPPAAGAAPAAEPLKTGALLLSRFVTAGSTDGTEYSPYSLLKSSEDLFGLSYLGKARGVKVRSFGVSLRGGEASAGD